MTPLLLVVYAFTVHRLTRLIVVDDFPPIRALRERILARWPSEDTAFTPEAATGTSGELFEHEGLYYPIRPHWVGELISCVWCASVWVAILVLPFFWAWPDVMMWVGAVCVASSVTGIVEPKV